MKKLLLLLLFPLYAWGQTSDANLKAVQIDPKIRNVTTSSGITKGNVSDVLQAIVNSKVSRIEANSTSGTNTYTATVTWVTGYSFGLNFPIVFNSGNSGAATLNINTLGAIALKKNGSTVLASGDLASGQVFWVFYDGSNFQVIGIGGSPSGFAVGGDLSGTLPNPTVAKLNGTTLSVTGTQLNYLNAAIGTSGSTSSSIVFSTTPSLNTPILNAPSIVGAMTGTGNYLPVSLFNSGTSASGTTVWAGDQSWKAPFTLTTTGSSGAATFSAGTLNIPQYSGGGGYATIANQGSNLTVRTLLNFSTGLTAVDNSGATRTDVTNNLSVGVSGGQSVIGGTASGNSLTHVSTTHATKGSHIFDAYLTNNFTGATQVSGKTQQMPTFNSGTTYQGGGWIVLNAAGSGYTSGSYNNVTFTYTSGTVATNVVLTGIVISGGIATGFPLWYWVSGGVGADGTTVWTASGIPGGSGFTVKTGTDYRSVQGDFFQGIIQNTTNGDNQIDGIQYSGYNYTGGGKANASEAAFGWNLENHWLQAGIGNFGQFENYMQGFYRNGTNSRPFGAYISKQDGSGYINFQADTYSFFTSPANGNTQFLSLGGVAGSMALGGNAAYISVANTNTNAGVFLVQAQTAGNILISNAGTTAFPNNYFSFNTPIKIGGTSASAESSPRDYLQIISTSSSANIANMSLNTAASSSAGIAFLQGTGAGSAGNRNIVIGIDGNVGDTYYGLAGSSNNLLWRSYNGAAFVTGMTLTLGTYDFLVGNTTSDNAKFYVNQSALTTAHLPVTRNDPGTHTVVGTTTIQRFNYDKAFTVNKTTTSATFTDIYGRFIETSIAGAGVTFTRNWGVGTNGNLQVQGKTYIGAATTAPSALLHLAAGTATAGTAPLIFTSGTNLTTAVAGVVEYDGTTLFFTPTGTLRSRVDLNSTVAASATTGTFNTAFNNTSVWTITPTGACTFNATGGVTGQAVTMIVTTSGTSSFVLTFGTAFKSTGTLATGTVSGKVFTIQFVYDGTNWNETARTVAM